MDSPVFPKCETCGKDMDVTDDQWVPEKFGDGWRWLCPNCKKRPCGAL